MKKSSFVAMLMGTVSGVLFALGMCMALVPEWDAFQPGIALGCIGLLLGLITVFVWRKLEQKGPIHVSAKTVFTILIGVIGVLTLGAGMCFCMIWNELIIGVIVGLIGILILLCLAPLTKGLKA